MTRVDSSDRRGGRITMSAALALSAAALLLPAASLSAQTLRGSQASLDQQNHVAVQHDFTYLRTPDQVRSFAERGLLIPVRPTADFDLHEVSFPYVRPEVAVFIERLASQYRAGCGQQLVVTSLTRPLSHQPSNASPRSVHPTGMAVDLRLPKESRCRSWLENVLLQLEGAGVLDATRESRPAHYHVVLFPRQYAAYLDRLDVRVATQSTQTTVTAQTAMVEKASESDGDEPEPAASYNEPGATYKVKPGDSLWAIAQKHGTTVEKLRAENALRTSRIYAGQLIVVPGR